MAGIYFHVPFCKSKCIYCDFYSLVDCKPDTDFVDLMISDLLAKKNFLNDHKITTVYFGGGTPSLLKPENIKHLLEAVSEHFDLNDRAEITFEANPDDLSKNYLAALKKTPVNRLSIGIQSFDDKLLKFLKRRHTARQAKDSICDAKTAGFTNISGDLIYSVPGMSGEIWKETLLSFFESDIQHLSAYDLIYEKDTLLYEYKNKHIISAEDDIKSEEYFTLLNGEALKHGFEHYELSNFAKKGYRSQHNSAYWNRASYIGIGPAAHSFNGLERLWNVSDYRQWADGLRKDAPCFESEILNAKDIFNELLITRLRTREGLYLPALKKALGLNYYNYLLKEAGNKRYSKVLKIRDNYLVLDKEYWFVSDNIISGLIINKSI